MNDGMASMGWSGIQPFLGPVLLPPRPQGLLAAGALIPVIGFARLVLAYSVLDLLLTAAIAWHWRQPLLARDAPANQR